MPANLNDVRLANALQHAKTRRDDQMPMRGSVSIDALEMQAEAHAIALHLEVGATIVRRGNLKLQATAAGAQMPRDDRFRPRVEECLAFGMRAQFQEQAAQFRVVLPGENVRENARMQF